MAMGKLPDADDAEGGGGVFADINITPLTDIFLVLLIIFMVTASAGMMSNNNGNSGVKVNLPKGGAKDVTQTQSDLAVAILQDGRTVVSGKVVSLDELKNIFNSTHAKNPDTVVIVQADESVTNGKVVEVMESAKTSGLSHLSIATRSE